MTAARYKSNDDIDNVLANSCHEKIREDTRLAQSIIRGMSAGMRHVESIDDPVLRYSMTISALHTAFAIGSEVWMSDMEDKHDKYQEELDKLNEIVPDTTEGSPFHRKLTAAILSLEKSIEMSMQNLETIKDFSGNINDHLDGISKWIQSPIYGPDHPCGKEMVKNLGESHKELEHSLEEMNLNKGFIKLPSVDNSKESD